MPERTTQIIYDCPVNFEQISSILRGELSRLRKEYKVAGLQAFGSYVRNEETLDSDLDLLVEFEETPTLLEFLALENDLSDLLGVRVDLVARDGLKPNIGARVLNEAVPL